MLEGYKATLKSTETEDWLDLHFIRPVCYLLACLFARLDIHPNTVTIWSMFVGAGSTYFFIQGCYYYEGTHGLVMNLIGMALLLFADILDCVDGQLARMTGKKSPMGRILDGVAGFTWFIPIYVGIVYRFYCHHEIEFGWLGIEDTPQNALIAAICVFIFGCISGFIGMGGQQRIADYYIQVHLFFLKGEKGSELDNSEAQQAKLDAMTSVTPWAEREFQKTYVDYTKKQEAVTPQFQRLLKIAKEKYGSAADIPANLREEFHKESLALMPWNGLLTFNFRTAWFYLFCLLDVPVMNFLWEGIAMTLLYLYIKNRHESFSRRIADKL